MPVPQAAPPAVGTAAAPEPAEPPAAAIIADALPPAAAPEPLLAPPEAPAPPPLAPSATPPAASDVTIPAPDPALLETSPYGPLPRITTDGREARRLYARPFPAEEARPRIALVVGGFGLSPTRSEEALRRLPPATTLAFTPQAMRPDLLLTQARARGMEVALGLPLESSGAEPNEQTLRPGLMHWENQDRLHRALGRMAGYAGVIGAIGAQRGDRFAADRAQLEAVQEEAQARGLYYLEPRPGAPAPAEAAGAVADLILDEPLTRGEVERRLARLEEIARERGFALGLAAEPAPLLVDRIAAWAAGLEARGLVLAPASALTRPPGPAPSAAR
ncbi:divergent polysaccharide deacetylase family protein [Pseudoroseomonas cervicalis]|uniref:divergent polysaccharide deacetylase family protein n=1 Tax=Teichococcus cervicalis TaxID=204525 RepID=UPI0022F15AEF|nr:divergent polysaccharide deacetylase family protein [Pseudoroseomonas cervicalis]WBV44002.1 divergent polysaccharide deacetylase family protein [Pseudoroseomonas cervicalis]